MNLACKREHKSPTVLETVESKAASNAQHVLKFNARHGFDELELD